MILDAATRGTLNSLVIYRSVNVRLRLTLYSDSREGRGGEGNRDCANSAGFAWHKHYIIARYQLGGPRLFHYRDTIDLKSAGLHSF